MFNLVDIAVVVKYRRRRAAHGGTICETERRR